jgi:hypothetical protein
MLRTPVVFIIFNRPETTRAVFEKIREAQPRELYIVADGPREHVHGEQFRCLEARAVAEHVDWDCRVYRDYSDINLGCRKRIVSGLDWVFENVAEAVILEDDCLPHSDFFPFCETLLERYRHNDIVKSIGGNNFQRGRRRTTFSYYFSLYGHIWGWATWRRAWQQYNASMDTWPEVREHGLLYDILGDERAAEYWSRKFQLTYEGLIDTWDYQWQFCCWMNNGLSLVPAVNLASNIGFGVTAVHTKRWLRSANIPSHPIPFPLHHPRYIIRNREADEYTQRTHHDRKTATRIFDLAYGYYAAVKSEFMLKFKSNLPIASIE